MHARIGDVVQPVAQLRVQVVEIAEDAAEKEVLANITKRPLDLALGLGAIGPAGARVKAVMAGEVDKPTIVDDEAPRVLADDRGLHAIVEDLARRAADRLQARRCGSARRSADPDG